MSEKLVIFLYLSAALTDLDEQLSLESSYVYALSIALQKQVIFYRKLQKATQEEAAQFILQPQYADYPVSPVCLQPG